MKRITTKASLIILSLLAVCASTKAQVPVVTGNNSTPIQFKLIGKVENQPLFQLTMNNDEKTSYFITIRDGDDDILYTERIFGTVIARKYLLDIDESDLNDPHFRLRIEISGTNHRQAAVFNVTKSIKVIEDILIAKI